MNTQTSARLDQPAVYVGTYRKYNDGNINGAWLIISEYVNHAAFMAAVSELHADEIAAHGEIEPMFQDFQCFPKDFYSESRIDPALWDYLDCDIADDVKRAWMDNGNDWDGESEDAINEAYQGEFTSAADWAEGYLTGTGGLEGVPDHLAYYIDFQAYGRDAVLNGDMWCTDSVPICDQSFGRGHWFRNN